MRQEAHALESPTDQIQSDLSIDRQKTGDNRRSRPDRSGTQRHTDKPVRCYVEHANSGFDANAGYITASRSPGNRLSTSFDPRNYSSSSCKLILAAFYSGTGPFQAVVGRRRGTLYPRNQASSGVILVGTDVRTIRRASYRRAIQVVDDNSRSKSPRTALLMF